MSEKKALVKSFFRNDWVSYINYATYYIYKLGV